MSKTYKRNDNRRPKWDKHSSKKSRKQRELDKDEFKHRPRPASQDVLDGVLEELSEL